MGQVYRSLRDYKKGCGGKDEPACSVLKNNAELTGLNLESKKEPSSELATEATIEHKIEQTLAPKAE